MQRRELYCGQMRESWDLRYDRGRLQMFDQIQNE